MAFVTAKSMLASFKPRLIVGVEGAPFTGKTHFALTMPKPLFIQNIDRGLEGVLNGQNVDRVEVADYAPDIPAWASATQSQAVDIAKRFAGDFRGKLAVKSRLSIAHDTSSEFWRLFRLADLGKLKQVPPMRYDRVNMMWADLLNGIYNTPHNLVLVHRVKDKYRESVNENTGEKISSKVEGETERDGFKNAEYIVQIFIKTMKRVTAKGKTEFGFVVTKCRQRAELYGREYWGAFATFPVLAMDVYPDTSEEDWGL